MGVHWPGQTLATSGGRALDETALVDVPYFTWFGGSSDCSIGSYACVYTVQQLIQWTSYTNRQTACNGSISLPGTRRFLSVRINVRNVA